MEEDRSCIPVRRYEKDIGGLIMDGIMELRIYNIEDRLTVAKILIKNGYTVSQGKRQKSSGKSVDYVLKISEDADNTQTVK